MKIFYLFIFLILGQSIYAQDSYNSESYIVTKNDLELNSYSKDSTANALVIYEKGNSYIDKNTFKLIFEHQQKLKILTRDGFDKATVTLYLYNNDGRKEKVDDIIAITHNSVNGQDVRTQLDKSQIFTEKYNDNYTLVKFTLPKIQEGSVITYSYTIESPFVYKFKGWNFQDDIPKIYSEYNTSIPANYEYNIKLVGSLPLIKNESSRHIECIRLGNGGSADCFTSVYAMRDIPAFIDEDYMTTRDNYLASIDYELKIFRGFDGTVENITKTWETVDDELKSDPNIGRQLVKNVSSNISIADSVLANSNSFYKAKGIYEYVQSNFIWNGEYSIYNNSSVKDLVKNKSGNVAEINILLHNLLDEYGIKVYPVLISTRNHGLPTKIYPVISDFNYLIVQAEINNKIYLLDATDPYLSFGMLPFRSLNQYGRKLDFKNGSEWINIIPSKNSTISRKIQLEIDSEGKMSGTMHANSTGYHALPKKESFFENSINYYKNTKDNSSEIEIINHEVEEKEKSSFNFKETIEFEANTEEVGGLIYLDPFIFKYFKENPFKLQERTYPIDFGYKDSFLYNLTLNVDESYEIVEAPQPLNAKLPNNSGELIFKVLKDGNNIRIYYEIDFDEEIYEREYYSYLKKFMDQVVNSENKSLIVIKKK